MVMMELTLLGQVQWHMKVFNTLRVSTMVDEGV